MSDCIFCKIVAKEIPAQELFRDEYVVAFKDVNAQAPVHVLVVPVKHHAHLTAFADAGEVPELARMLTAAAEVGRLFGTDGYRVVINEGRDGGQTVHHLHAHVLAGRALSWPPG